ncbi:MAG: hypothetical protein M5R38_12185 [Candidatus Methylomirabilis sp.]|nr:hypothetical protein [Candidatus Methylomirabilis sp.]
MLELIPTGKECDFSRDLLPRLMREGRPLYGYVAPGYWKDVGDLIEYRLAHRDILAGLVKVTPPASWWRDSTNRSGSAKGAASISPRR